MRDVTVSLYLELLKKILTNVIYEDPPIPNPVTEQSLFDRATRETGSDWPSVAHTMVGTARLDNVQECLERVITESIPGDFIETGVWRGGVCILARGVFKAYGVEDRKVWVADSFEGIPVATRHPNDRLIELHRFNEVLGISEQTVRKNFARYGLLDDQVEFLPGWFRDTLPTAPIERLSVLRLDGDLYESTMDALVNLYPKLSPGGYVIVDDYLVPGCDGCRDAVDQFRADHQITDPIEKIDDWSIYWRNREPTSAC